jgi:hypothetical protein
MLKASNKVETKKTFFGVGIKRTFIEGGVGRDEIRNVSGEFGGTFGNGDNIKPEKGAFSRLWQSNSVSTSGALNVGVVANEMNLSRVVPTGLENSPRTLSCCYWQRVA